MERSGRAKWAGRPKAAQTRARAGGRRERAGGPGSPRAVPGGTRLSAARLTVRREHAMHARGRGRDAVHARGPRWTQAELAPTWRLRGCHAGRREVDDDPAANGRRAAVASGGANHGDTGKSVHTGRLHVTRGDEPTARIRRRLLDGGGLRRRQPAAGEEGNGDEVTRGRFPAVRASTRLRELDASVGLNGATPSEAGDERVLRSSGGDGGEHTASDGNEEGEGAAEVPFRVLERTGSPGAWRRTAEARQSTGAAATRRDDTGDRRGLARQRVTAAATGRSATRHARAGNNGRRGWAAGPGDADGADDAARAGNHAGARASDGARGRLCERGARARGGGARRGSRTREQRAGGGVRAKRAGEGRGPGERGGERERERESAREREGRGRDGPSGIRPIEPGGGKLDFWGGIRLGRNWIRN
uniref:Epstein-Barr virus EBNA-1-like protein n=1 Tax=Oryza sativa subsp. japonica TaxID=39947 RepID=Q6Z4M2_ORYSJ|nr:Epstein-Barr virus EBNA-1-like protein [Oryza sativa Japonica Group]